MSTMDPNGEFVVWDASVQAQRLEWEALWRCGPTREGYAHPGYVALFANAHTRGMCAAWRSDHAVLLFPFLFRNVSAEVFFPPDVIGATDITSPYGYGGCYGWNLTAGAGHSFWAAFTGWAMANRVVSEFVRFNLLPHATVGYPGDVEERQPNVVRSLNENEATL